MDNKLEEFERICKKNSANSDTVNLICVILRLNGIHPGYETLNNLKALVEWTELARVDYEAEMKLKVN